MYSCLQIASISSCRIYRKGPATLAHPDFGVRLLGWLPLAHGVCVKCRKNLLLFMKWRETGIITITIIYRYLWRDPLLVLSFQTIAM